MEVSMVDNEDDIPGLQSMKVTVAEFYETQYHHMFIKHDEDTDEQINRLAKKGWRVVDHSIADDGNIISIMFTRQIIQP